MVGGRRDLRIVLKVGWTSDERTCFGRCLLLEGSFYLFVQFPRAEGAQSRKHGCKIATEKRRCGCCKGREGCVAGEMNGEKRKLTILVNFESSFNSFFSFCFFLIK